MLVSVDWLAEHLAEVTVLDATLPPVGVTPAVDVRGRYLAKHLPGALFFDIDELSDHTSGLPHTLPSGEAFGEAMSRLGVEKTGRIVVYEQVGVFSAPRARWMLTTFGAREVFLLNGGLEAWERAGLPVESGEVVRPPAEFPAELRPGAVVSFDAMRETVAEGGQVLDARSAGRFAGTAPEPRAGLRSGHMAGATSLPFTELVSEGRMKRPEEIARIFRERGIDLDGPVTTTCGSGVTAAVLALGLEMSGATDVRLYDGSWAEWVSQPGAEIVEG